MSMRAVTMNSLKALKSIRAKEQSMQQQQQQQLATADTLITSSEFTDDPLAKPLSNTPTGTTIPTTGTTTTTPSTGNTKRRKPVVEGIPTTADTSATSFNSPAALESTALHDGSATNFPKPLHPATTTTTTTAKITTNATTTAAATTTTTSNTYPTLPSEHSGKRSEDLTVDDQESNQRPEFSEDDAESDVSEDEEDAEDYCKGGYHPVSIGDSFLDGRYTVVRKLGWGHFSTVWLAKDNKYHRPVALKIVRSASNYTEAAIDEIKLLEKVVNVNRDDPHRRFIVELSDSFKVKGPNGTHIVMAFEVLGPNLWNMIRRYHRRGIPIDIEKRITKQMVMGLDYLHTQCGIIHTDLKPENVLIAIDVPETMRQLGLYDMNQESVVSPLQARPSAYDTASLPHHGLTHGSDHKHTLSGSIVQRDRSSATLVKGDNDSLDSISDKQLSKSQKKKAKKKAKEKAKKQALKRGVGCGSGDGSFESMLISESEVNDQASTPENMNLARPVHHSSTSVVGHSGSDMALSGPLTDSDIVSDTMDSESVTSSVFEEVSTADGLTMRSRASKPISPLSSSLLDARLLEDTGSIQGSFESMFIPTASAVADTLFSDRSGSQSDHQVYSHDGSVPGKHTAVLEKTLSDISLLDAYQPDSPHALLLSPHSDNAQYLDLPAQHASTNVAEDDSIDEVDMDNSPAHDTFDRKRRRNESKTEASRRADRNVIVKLADLGNACWVNHHFTGDIQTRQYRSPEVIIGASYDTSADMWSLGCIVFELLTGDYMFDPQAGSRYTKDDDHAAQIVELLGNFPKSLALSGKYSNNLFNRKGELRHIHRLRYWKLQDVLHEKYHFSVEDAADISSFILPALEIHPTKRATAAELLSHKWLADVVI
ncbi:hypothetical protein BSLG_002083 [Batrachochytrium salamandrivorans]|nr:hypothetical protein BSLG_002083 [Batrachochytrium salamandrivorans]